jgi:hypothetical protein
LHFDRNGSDDCSGADNFVLAVVMRMVMLVSITMIETIPVTDVEVCIRSGGIRGIGRIRNFLVASKRIY